MSLVMQQGSRSTEKCQTVD